MQQIFYEVKLSYSYSLSLAQLILSVYIFYLSLHNLSLKAIKSECVFGGGGRYEQYRKTLPTKILKIKHFSP